MNCATCNAICLVAPRRYECFLLNEQAASCTITQEFCSDPHTSMLDVFQLDCAHFRKRVSRIIATMRNCLSQQRCGLRQQQRPFVAASRVAGARSCRGTMLQTWPRTMIVH